MTAGHAVGDGRGRRPRRGAAGRHRRGARPASRPGSPSPSASAPRCSTRTARTASASRTGGPEALVDLPQFPGDNLDTARSGGDLCVQACADDPQVAVHAIRNLARIGFGKVAVRWSQLGFGKTSSTTPDAQTPRNMFGFKDGTRNIAGTDTAALDQHVWVVARTDGAGLDGRRLVPRRPPHPDAHRDLGPHLAPGAGGRLRPGQGRGRAGRQGQHERDAPYLQGDAARPRTSGSRTRTPTAA